MRYLLYGLSAESDRPLPGLRPDPASATAPDVRLWLGAHPPGFAPACRVEQTWYVSDRTAPSDEPSLVIRRTADGGWFVFRYADGTEISVDAAGGRVGCTWPDAATLEDTATYLLGPVFGFLLRRRGVTCLHASAVAVDDRAVLVCGPAGAGKSTTAAAFARRGRAVLCDDLSALDPAPDGIRVRPAYPHVRLWPESVRALYGADDHLPPLTPTWDKRYLDLAERADAFHAEPLPVSAVYLLADREAADAPRLEPVPAAEALLSLVANTYMGWLPDLAARGRDLAAYAALAKQAPVVRVVPHADAARLDDLCDLIETDARARGGADA